MSRYMDNPEQLIDAYVDGVLNEEDRAAFEDAMRQRPELAAEVELQAAIDTSMKRMFDPGDAGKGEEMQGHLAGRIGAKVFALAAAIVIVGVVAWMYVGSGGGGGGRSRRPVKIAMTPVEVYAAEVDAGFVPEEVCTTPEAFEDWIDDRYGQLLRPEARERVELVGWSYTDVLSPYSALLLARVEGREVLVLLDEIREDTGLTVDADAPIRLFRREFGNLVLYEITPLDESVVLEMLYVPEETDDGDGG